jgi:NAD(P) transhydrogenase subunit alpha
LSTALRSIGASIDKHAGSALCGADEFLMIIAGVSIEHDPNDARVALVPAVLPALAKIGVQVRLQRGAGERAGFADAEYEQHGAEIVASRADVLSTAGVLLQVGALPAAGAERQSYLTGLRPGQVIIGLLNPLGAADAAAELARAGVTSFALELLPRISRAQPMDALTSMASLAGYRGVLLAAAALPKLFPMMITAAGTIAPARVFVIGAGVAGLQAIATARRLGAAVQAYDVRPAVKEEVESLGAKFVVLGLESEEAGGAGAYARAMGEAFYRRQREMLTKVVAESEVVLTTAAVPGAKAPTLLTEEMVRGMRRGAVVVDLAADSGGNCELTRPGATLTHHGVTIIGALNLAATVAYDASQMYARNLSAFLRLLVKDGALQPDSEDQIIRETLLTHGGEVVHPRVRERLGLPELSGTTDEHR